MLWSRRPSPLHEKARAVGLDLTASRIRAVTIAAGKTRSLLLNDPDEALPLFVSLLGRTPEVGWAGYSHCRKTPHAVCSNFLAALGQPRVWKAGRHTLTPAAALELSLAATGGVVSAEAHAAVLALPAYLTPTQVSQVVSAAARVRLPLKGTAVGALALVADRATAFLSGKPTPADPPPPDWAVPLRPADPGPGTVVVIDADEYALSAAVVAVERDRVRLLASAAWPRLAARLWKEKLLDAVCDRCVRLCRRDPRDCAEAEQELFEQLDEALERVRGGSGVSLTVRTDHWYQDLIQQPEDFDGYCRALARGSGEAVAELLESAALPAPPRAVWLTHEAGLLPGLAHALRQYTPEGTTVEVLPAVAVARAAAALVPRWLVAELPRVHLDAIIPVPVPAAAPAPAAYDPRPTVTGPTPRSPS